MVLFKKNIFENLKKDNARSNKDVYDKKLELEGSYVVIYVNNEMLELKNIKSSKIKDQKYTRKSEVRISSLNETYSTQSGFFKI